MLQTLLLESLDWKSGDFVPDYGYYYGLINNKLIFLSGPNYPFRANVMLELIEIKEGDDYIIKGIKFRIPTLNEVFKIFQHRHNSYLANIIFPTKISISDYADYCFNTMVNKKQQYDPNTQNISTLLINNVNLNIL